MAGKVIVRKLETRGAGRLNIRVITSDQDIDFTFDLRDRDTQNMLARMILGAPADNELFFELLGDGVRVNKPLS